MREPEAGERLRRVMEAVQGLGGHVISRGLSITWSVLGLPPRGRGGFASSVLFRKPAAVPCGESLRGKEPGPKR